MGKYKGFAGSGMNANKNMSNAVSYTHLTLPTTERV